QLGGPEVVPFLLCPSLWLPLGLVFEVDRLELSLAARHRLDVRIRDVGGSVGEHAPAVPARDLEVVIPARFDAIPRHEVGTEFGCKRIAECEAVRPRPAAVAALVEDAEGA